jgi:hypothetical protein
MYLPEKVPFDAGNEDDVQVSNHLRDMKASASLIISRCMNALREAKQLIHQLKLASTQTGLA